MNSYQFNEKMRLHGKPIKGKQFKSKVGTQGNREKNRRLKQMNRKYTDDIELMGNEFK